MASIKTLAIVLKTSHFSESDKLVVLLTREFGKLHAIAKGALKLTSKFGARLLPLAYDDVMLSQGRNLDILTECQTIDLFPKLREDLFKMGLALRIAHFLEETLPLGYSHPELFELFQDLLESLSTTRGKETAQMMTLGFLFKFLEHEGHAPQLRMCVICRREIRRTPQKIAFEVKEGGIICRECRRSYPNARILPYSSIQLLEMWKGQNFLELAHKSPAEHSTWLTPLIQDYTELAIR